MKYLSNLEVPSQLAVVAMALFALVTLGIVAVQFIKVRRIDLRLWDIDSKRKQEFDRLFWQMEALDSLNRLLALRRPLPATRGLTLAEAPFHALAMTAGLKYPNAAATADESQSPSGPPLPNT